MGYLNSLGTERKKKIKICWYNIIKQDILTDFFVIPWQVEGNETTGTHLYWVCCSLAAWPGATQGKVTGTQPFAFSW